jgi:hypothetical protein
MNADQGRQFLAALGTKVESQTAEWLRARCPLAPWTHPSGHDTSPSFGLTIAESSHSAYHCFACSTGSPEQLIQALELHTNYGKDTRGRSIDLAKARETLEHEELKVVPLPTYSEFGAAPSKVFVPWDESTLEVLPLAAEDDKARQYLKYRGFDPQTVGTQLLVDPYRDMIVFPYRDVYGRLAGMRGRLMDFGQKLYFPDGKPRLKHYDYTLGEGDNKGPNNSYFCWYGEECLNEGGTVVVVEGQFDCLRVRQVYPRVVANMTAKPSSRKVEKLAYAANVIILMDNDATGQAASEMWAQRLRDLGTNVGYLSIANAPKAQFFIDRDGPGAPKDPDELDLVWLRNQLQPFL